MTINPTKLHQEFLSAGLPIDGIRFDNIPVWTRELTQEEQHLSDTIIANHNPVEVVLPGIDERLSAVEGAILYQILGGV